MIVFNEPPYVKTSKQYIEDAIQSNKICGDGKYTQYASEFFKQQTGVSNVLMTTSCTHAYELAALLADIQEGDEVIMPSYTFVSTANPFVLRGATVVFVDIDPRTMNIDPICIEAAITKKTKAICPVHYAGVSCDMDRIMELAEKNNLYVFEDAAQGVLSKYKGRYLGSIGDFGAFSFHETKNYSMGEGGALLLRDAKYGERAEIVREKGTNRSKFHRGQVDKYTWVDLGSSYLPSELNVAYLWAQLEAAESILEYRMLLWNTYEKKLTHLSKKGYIELPYIPDECEHNAHMFYIKTKDIEERQQLIDFLLAHNILAVFHYIPLHSAPAGIRFGRFHGEDRYTTRESERLLRLPLHMHLEKDTVKYICECIEAFYTSSK